MFKSNAVSQTAAVAIAAARAIDALHIWLERLTPAQVEEVRRRLHSKQEWLAVNLWNDATNRRK